MSLSLDCGVEIISFLSERLNICVVSFSEFNHKEAARLSVKLPTKVKGQSACFVHHLSLVSAQCEEERDTADGQ